MSSSKWASSCAGIVATTSPGPGLPETNFAWAKARWAERAPLQSRTATSAPKRSRLRPENRIMFVPLIVFGGAAMGRGLTRGDRPLSGRGILYRGHGAAHAEGGQA